MSRDANLIRTNLYVSRRVWGQLKARAFDERATISALVDFVLRAYLQDLKAGRAAKGAAAHRAHDGAEDRKPRAVYLDPAVWRRFQEAARAAQVSAASLAESLLLSYVGGEEDAPEAGAPEAGAVDGPAALDPRRYVRVGDEIYDLGDASIILKIDPDEESKKGG